MSESSRAPMPDNASASSLPDSSSPDETNDAEDLSHLPPAHQDVVRRLRTKVERATALLNSLQAENDRLRQRIKELEDRPAVPDGQTIFALDDDPDALQDRISDFIDAIDAYLEDGPPASTEAVPSDSEDTTS